MKKIILIIVFTCINCIPEVTFSQTGNKFKFGIKAGANFSNISADNANNNKVLTGFNFGIFTKVPVTKSFAIQPEIYFTTKGAEHTYQNVFVDGTAKYDLNYIEVPVLMVFNLSNNFNFQIGPYFSYLVDAKIKNVSDVNFFNFEDNIDSNDINNFDTGLVAGLGIDIKSFGVGVRYYYGFITVGKEENYSGTNYTFPDGKNSVINLYLSYSIL